MSDTGLCHHEPQDEAPGPIAVSNIEQEDIHPDKSDNALIRGFSENCRMLSKCMVDTKQQVDHVEQQVGHVKQQVDSMGGKVDALSSDIGDIKRQMAIDNSPYAKLFECEENKMMLSVLPLLCDSRYGVAGWIPVWHKNVLYIVLSKRVTVSLMEVSVNVKDTTMSDVLQRHLKSAPINTSLFAEVILKTPFRTYKRTKRNDGTKWLNNNLAIYKVMTAEWFRGLIDEIHSRCDVADELCDDAVKMEMKHNHMYSDVGLSSQFDVGPCVYDCMGDGFKMSHGKLVAAPAMKCEWGLEALESGCRQYFGMEEVDGVMGVVTNGKYKEPFEDEDGLIVKSVSYDTLVRQLMIKKPGLFSDEVKDVHPDLFDKQPDVATKCKKRKNRAS